MTNRHNVTARPASMKWSPRKTATALPDQRAELRALQDLRHQGSCTEHHLGSPGRHWRPELPQHVSAPRIKKPDQWSGFSLWAFPAQTVLGLSLLPPPPPSSPLPSLPPFPFSLFPPFPSSLPFSPPPPSPSFSSPLSFSRHLQLLACQTNAWLLTSGVPSRSRVAVSRFRSVAYLLRHNDAPLP